MTRLLRARPILARSRHSAELTSVVVDRIEALDGLFARFIPATVMAVAAPISVVVVVAALDHVAGIILALTGLLVPVAMALSGLGASTAASRDQFLALTRLQARFLDRIRGIATTIMHGRAEDEARALARSADELRMRTMRVLVPGVPVVGRARPRHRTGACVVGASLRESSGADARRPARGPDGAAADAGILRAAAGVLRRLPGPVPRHTRPPRR